MWEVQKMKITEVVANSLYRYQNLEMEFVWGQRLLQLWHLLIDYSQENSRSVLISFDLPVAEPPFDVL